MQEIETKYSIKRKKLMKTTTLITLLVAATMILSGAVTGITMNMNKETTMIENGNNGEGPLGTGEEPISVYGADSEEYDIFDENGVEAKVRHQGQIIWDNGLDYIGLYRGEVGSGVTSIIADDFKFTFDAKVMDVHWIGGYWSGSAETPWCIMFYEDDGSGGKPGDDFEGPFCFDWDDITKTPEGSYWFMSVDIPAVTFQANQKYWIAIYAEGTSGAPYAGPAMHWSVLPGTHEAMWIWPENGYSDWTPTGTITGYPPADMVFQLTTKPDHDVGVTEIKHPTHMDSPGCPCIPVEVEVRNLGSNDEFDVPVTVEIHQNLWTQTFGGDIPDEMPFDITGYDCTWQYSPVETCYPNAITPFDGNWFAELNQCGCLGTSYLTTAIPTDLTGQCIDPFLKFYFWHDTYSSDDNVEVEASINGIDWVPIGGPYYRLCCPNCPVGWQEYRISLAAYIGQPTVFFRFVGNCEMPTECYNLGIDYVSVFDLQYQETQEIDIDAGETQQVEFPCWSGECWWCQYENEDVLFHVGAWTEMEGDENPGNDGFGPVQTDYLPVLIHIPYTHDVGDKEIKEPAEDYYMAQPLEMVQVIKNYGKEPEGCFNVYMSVQETEIVTKLDEEFAAWEYNPPPDGSGSYYDDRPVGWRDYGTNYYYDYGWEPSYTNQAGGTSPEARLYYGYIVNYRDMILESPSINTEGEDKLVLEFKTYFDFDEWYWEYYGYEVTVAVEVTPDGGTSGWTDVSPWTNPRHEDIPKSTHEIDISAFIGPDTQVRFRFFGYGYAINYWYIDDVKFISTTYGDQVYSEKACVDDIGVCQEIEIPFPDWTPEPPEPCYCGTQGYAISSWTKMLDPPDQNSANDKKTKFVTIEWLHDVGIKEFTSPAYDVGRLDWIQYSDETIENALGLTTGGNTITEAIKLTPAELSAYTNHEITKVRVCKGYPGYNFEHDYEVWMYTGAQPTDPDAGTVVATGTSPQPSGWFEIDTDDYAFDPTDTVWIGINWDHHTVSTFPISLDDSVYIAGKSSWFTYDVGSGWVAWMEYAPYTMMLGAGVEPADGNGEVPEPDIYIPCGEQEFCVMIENLGTYDEDVTVVWTFYEYTPDKEVVDSGSVDLSIDSLTEEEVCLFTYLFEEEGVYEVEVEVLSPPDCNLDNNGPISLVVGADCCGPESCFVIDPESPDGENNWYVSKVTTTVDAWDLCEIQSGIEKIVYIIDGVEDFIPGDHGTFVIDGDGVHFIEIYAVDKVGNEEEEHRTFEVAIDETAPTIDLVHELYQDEDGNYMIDLSATANDDTSGMNRVEFKIDGVLDLTLYAAPYDWTVIWEEAHGTATFSATAFDDAGNSATDSIIGIKTTTHTQSQTQQVVKVVQRVVTLNLGR